MRQEFVRRRAPGGAGWQHLRDRKERSEPGSTQLTALKSVQTTVQRGET